MPFAQSTKWIFTLGPHNIGSEGANGLDFVDQGNKTVVAVNTGVIKVIERGSGIPCDIPTRNCKESGTAIREDVLINGQPYQILYYHLDSSTKSYTANLKVGMTVQAGEPIGIEGGTGFSEPPGFVHLWIGINNSNGQPYSLGGSANTCTSVYFSNWQVCDGKQEKESQSYDGVLHWTGFPTYGNDNQYDRYALYNGGIKPLSQAKTPNIVFDDLPNMASVRSLEAGHVMSVTSPLIPIPLQQNITPLCKMSFFLSSGTHVVVLDDKEMQDPNGNVYYKVAYPDPCHPGPYRDFSSNQSISDKTGAVGWLLKASLQEMNNVHAVAPNADWRPCWGPNLCKDQTYAAGKILKGADGSSLYAWWTGLYWDPHWFHVLQPDGRQAAVYGRDWNQVATCVAATNAGAHFEADIANVQHTNVIASPCGNGPTPPPIPSPPTNIPTSPPIPSSPTNIPSVDNSQWVSNTQPITLQPGQQFSIQFTYQNDGTTTWSDSGYALACDTYYHTSSNCMRGNPVGFSGQSVGPNQQYTFTVSLTVPSSPGTYTTWWDMTHNGSIFGNNNSYVTVMVAAPSTQGWKPLLQQSAPNCSNPGGTTWSNALPGTAISCTDGELLMQQTSSSYYAEVDLEQASGSTYSQTAFRVGVQATFQYPGDHSTWAAVLVQTPQASGVAGGFILAVNPVGQWQLQQVVTGSNIPVVQNGTVSVNPSQSITITVAVQNGVLTGFIAGQQVVTYNDNLNPLPGAVSLMVERPHAAPSSAVLYSTFELDMWR